MGARLAAPNAHWHIQLGLLTSLHCVQPPGFRHAPEFVLAPVLELDPRSRHQVFDGRGDQNVGRVGEGANPGGDVYGKATEVITPNLALAGMQPNSNLDPERPRRLDDGSRRSEWPEQDRRRKRGSHHP